MLFNSSLIHDFYSSIESDQTHRYKSWEHCFKAFQKINDIDTLALHLGFYLASWGMYRGSSGLLQKDYKIHIGAVEILTKPKFKALHCLSTEVGVDNADLILELIKELSNHYNGITHSNNTKNVTATDTLISKVILGTLGCLPAYDRYFIDGLRASGMSGYSLSKRSLENLFEFITENKTSLLKTQKEISNNGTHYPLMKLVDMHFWMIGFDVEKNNN